MARRKPRMIGGAAHPVYGMDAAYRAAKRRYHETGLALYKARHGGKSPHSRRKRRTKHRRSR